MFTSEKLIYWFIIIIFLICKWNYSNLNINLKSHNEISEDGAKYIGENIKKLNNLWKLNLNLK